MQQLVSWKWWNVDLVNIHLAPNQLVLSLRITCILQNDRKHLYNTSNVSVKSRLHVMICNLLPLCTMHFHIFLINIVFTLSLHSLNHKSFPSQTPATDWTAYVDSKIFSSSFPVTFSPIVLCGRLILSVHGHKNAKVFNYLAKSGKFKLFKKLCLYASVSYVWNLNGTKANCTLYRQAKYSGQKEGRYRV